MKLIGLVGKKQSGKDTVCGMIIESSPRLAPARLAFADCLKEEVAAATGKSILDINQQKDRFRPILQWWGTEFRRHEDREYWIRRMREKVTLMRELHAGLVIITDVRFRNEADLVASMGGALVRVMRPTQRGQSPIAQSAGLTPLDAHASETEQDEIRCEWCLFNDRTMEDLRSRVVMMMEAVQQNL